MYLSGNDKTLGVGLEMLTCDLIPVRNLTVSRMNLKMLAVDNWLETD